MNDVHKPSDTVLADCITALICPIGEFYPNKNYGSRIKYIMQNTNEKEMLCYARQALNSMDGVYVKNAKIQDKSILFSIMINDEERQAIIAIE